jgi:C-terminal processing protease CtpA/Prc
MLSETVQSGKLDTFSEDPSAEWAAEQPSTYLQMKDVIDDESEDQTPETAPTMTFESAKPLALAAKQVKATHYVEFDAPPGKLGIVIDTSKGTAIVDQVHALSSIKAHIAVGDKLCEVDGVNTRHMTHTAISALMSANSGHLRHFKVERQSNE